MASYAVYNDMMSKEARDFDNLADDDMRELDDLTKSPYLDQAFPYYFGTPINGPAQDAGSGIEKAAASDAHNSLTTGFEMLPVDSDSLFEDIPRISPSLGFAAALIESNSAVVSNQAATQGQKWHTAASTSIGHTVDLPGDVTAIQMTAYPIPHTWEVGSAALIPSAAEEQSLQGLEHNIFHNSLSQDDSPLYLTPSAPDRSPLSFHPPTISDQGNSRTQTLRASTKKVAFDNTPNLSPAETSLFAAAPELDKQQGLELLTAGTPREVTFVKKTTNSDINKWCRELYEYSLQRTQNESSTLPPRPKRGGCHNSPEYLTNSDRVRAIANVLHDDKRACFRFNGDNSWSHKLADDPMWQRDAICTNDKGNSDKARRAQQSKDNATTIVQVLRDLRQVLLVAPSDMTVEILLERFDHIEKLAVYIQDPPKADQEAGNPLAKGRGKRTNNTSEQIATDELESPEKDALLSPYTTRATPSSVNQQMRNTHLRKSLSKKRKLTDAHGVPGTPTPSRKVYPTIIPSSPQMAPAHPYADPSAGLKARSPVSDTVTAEVEVTTSQLSPVLLPRPASLDPNLIYSIEEIRQWHVSQRAYQLQWLNRIQHKQHGDFLQAQRQIPTEEGRQRNAQKFFDDRQEQCIRRVGELDRKLQEHVIRCLENRKRLQQALAGEGAPSPALAG